MSYMAYGCFASQAANGLNRGRLTQFTKWSETQYEKNLLLFVRNLLLFANYMRTLK